MQQQQPKNNVATPAPANIIDKLFVIQNQLKCPKDRPSEEGWFYRSAEDILRVVKPLCHECGLLLLFNDTPVLLGNTVQIISKVTLIDKDGVAKGQPESLCRIEASTGIAVHPYEVNRSAAQLSGASISYAHKVVLSNLFALDNTGADAVDPDASLHNNSRPSASPLVSLYEGSADWANVLDYVRNSRDTNEQILSALRYYYSISDENFRRLLACAGRA